MSGWWRSAETRRGALAARWAVGVALVVGGVVPVQGGEERNTRGAKTEVAIPFRDVTEEAGISFRHSNGAAGEKLLPETMGGGVAFFDYEGDGDADLLFVDSGSWRRGTARPGVVLYANDGRGRFNDVTAATGIGRAVGAGFYGMGVAIGDVDGDGWRDVFLTGVGGNRLLRNERGRFVEVTASAGLAGARGWSTGAAFFDADGDGDLDLAVTDYLEWSPALDRRVEREADGVGRTYGRPQSYGGGRLWLYRNDGDGRFAEVAAASGLAVADGDGRPAGKGLAVVPLDADGDGALDLFVANDTVRNFLFVGDGGGRFAERGELAGVAWDPAGRATGAMGVDVGWLDGRPAVAVGNYAAETSSLFLAEGDGLYADQALARGLAAATREPLTFGLLLADLDLDGRLDLVQANGHVEPDVARLDRTESYRQPAQLLWNAGRRFVELPAAAVGDLARPLAARGLAAADVDGDGDLDLAITEVGGAARLLRNDQAAGHHWLRVTLRGPEGNPDAIGAVVELAAGGTVQRRFVSPTRSYLSQVEPTATFGLGEATTVDSLTVTWPDGRVQRLPGARLAVDRELTVTAPAGRPAERP